MVEFAVPVSVAADNFKEESTHTNVPTWVVKLRAVKKRAVILISSGDEPAILIC